MVPLIKGQKKLIFCALLSVFLLQGSADVCGAKPVPVPSAAAVNEKTEAVAPAPKRPPLPAGVIPSTSPVLPPRNQKVRIVEPLPKIARRITVLERVEPVVKTYTPAAPVVDTEKIRKV